MPTTQTSAITPAQFTTFGDLLKFLRRRAGLSQQELSIGVGYSVSQISRLEKNQRAPDAAAVAARFVPELDLEKEKEWVARLLELAASSHAEIETPEEENRAQAKATPRHNLPIQFTSFIGRDQEIAEITQFFTSKSSVPQEVRLLWQCHIKNLICGKMRHMEKKTTLRNGGCRWKRAPLSGNG